MIQQLHFYVCAQKKWKQGLRYLYTHVHSGIIHNSQKVEATQVFVDRWMDKNIVYTYHGILFSVKKKWNSDTCYNVDEPRRHCPNK